MVCRVPTEGNYRTTDRQAQEREEKKRAMQRREGGKGKGQRKRGETEIEKEEIQRDRQCASKISALSFCKQGRTLLPSEAILLFL